MILSLILTASVLTSCRSNSDQTDTEKAELIVFAAASMTETLTELGKNYENDHPDTVITFNFDSSGTLKTQIAEGADCDLFISAAQKQMDELDLIDPATRIDLLENKVALCVPEGNPKNISSFDDMTKALQSGDILLSMGNADVPVGQYTQRIFDYFKLDEDKLSQKGLLTYGSNVKEVTSQVSESAVDCGVIYQTDAYSANLTIVDTATEAMCGQVIYPAAVLKDSKHTDAAKDFLYYLKGDTADAVFEKVGFAPIK